MPGFGCRAIQGISFSPARCDCPGTSGASRAIRTRRHAWKSTRKVTWLPTRKAQPNLARAVARGKPRRARRGDPDGACRPRWWGPDSHRCRMSRRPRWRRGAVCRRRRGARRTRAFCLNAGYLARLSNSRELHPPATVHRRAPPSTFRCRSIRGRGSVSSRLRWRRICTGCRGFERSWSRGGGGSCTAERHSVLLERTTHGIVSDGCAQHRDSRHASEPEVRRFRCERCAEEGGAR